MRTQIIIRHDSNEALKKSWLWACILSHYMVGESVEVIEIGVLPDTLETSRVECDDDL